MGDVSIERTEIKAIQCCCKSQLVQGTSMELLMTQKQFIPFFFLYLCNIPCVMFKYQLETVGKQMSSATLTFVLYACTIIFLYNLVFTESLQQTFRCFPTLSSQLISNHLSFSMSYRLRLNLICRYQETSLWSSQRAVLHLVSFQTYIFQFYAPQTQDIRSFTTPPHSLVYSLPRSPHIALQLCTPSMA